MTLKQRDLWLKEHAIEKRVFTADDVEYQAIKAEMSRKYAEIWEREGKGERVQNYNAISVIENIRKGV